MKDNYRNRRLNHRLLSLFLVVPFLLLSPWGISNMKASPGSMGRISIIPYTPIEVIKTAHATSPIKGKVAEDNGTPLPGVNVIVKGTAKGTITDIDGNFVIDAEQDDVLLFSFVGYHTKEVIVSKISLNTAIVLVQDTKTLEELVVVGYGVQEKRDVSGAVASVKGEAISNMPVQSADKALQGRAAGVQITGSGIPGGETRVRIRGSGSITAGNNPLYIVDGIQITSTNQSRLIETTNPLNSINPNDIESIDVLKDAASASIYGAQGANGVIIITTKRGKSGKTKFNFNTSLGAMNQLKKLDVINGPEFIALTLEAYRNRFGEDSDQYTNILNSLGRPEDAMSYDWQDAAFKTGVMSNTELSATGGSEKTTFYISGSYNNVDAHTVGNRYQRGNLRLNLDHKATDKLKISPSINVARIHQRIPPQGFFSTPTLSAPLIVPINPIYEENGELSRSEFGGGEPFFGSFNLNPIRDAELNETKAATTSLNTSLILSYTLTEGLNFKSSFALDYLDIKENRWSDPRTRDGEDNGGEATVFVTTVSNWQTDQVLTYDRTFNEKHQFNSILGFFYRQSERETLDAEGHGFPSPKLKTIQNAAVPNDVNSFFTLFKTAGVFGKINYIYDNRYIIAFTLRRDGHSRFGADNRWGTFPAVSAAWRITEESFMPTISWLDDMKLRLSYGITGNSAISNFASRGLFSSGGEYDGLPGLQPSGLSNTLLTWEENATTNIGLDLSLFQGRLSLGSDAYIRTNRDLLLDRPLPNTTGFDEITENAGIIRNSGIELEVSSSNIIIGDFSWDTDFNLAFQKSKVIELPDAIGDTLVLSNTGGWYVVGKPAFAYYLQEFAGINAADGRPFWLDKDGNPTYQQTSGNARKFRGVATPKWFGGITNTFTYKKLSLSTFFQFQGGNLVNNSIRNFTERAGSTADLNQNRSQLDRWQTPGDITDVAISVLDFAYPNDGASPFNVGNDTRNIEKGDYLRLKQIQLSYTLPSDWVSKIDLQRVQVYGQAINYWTLTGYSGLDPEFIGTEFGDIPQPKSLIFGLQVGF